MHENMKKAISLILMLPCLAFAERSSAANVFTTGERIELNAVELNGTRAEYRGQANLDEPAREIVCIQSLTPFFAGMLFLDEFWPGGGFIFSTAYPVVRVDGGHPAMTVGMSYSYTGYSKYDTRFNINQASLDLMTINGGWKAGIRVSFPFSCGVSMLQHVQEGTTRVRGSVQEDVNPVSLSVSAAYGWAIGAFSIHLNLDVSATNLFKKSLSTDLGSRSLAFGTTFAYSF
jgi:hypothetical protein